jgi:C1A family cysteine protease
MWSYILNFISKFLKKKQTEIEFAFGLLKDEIDERDHWFKTTMVTPSKEYQPVDLRPLCPPVRDQGSLGACTAFGAGYAVQFSRKKQNLRSILDPSPLFTYYNTRLLQNTVNQDSGGSIRNAIKAIAKYGVITERQWPYDISKFTNEPHKNLYTQAGRFQALGYKRITDGSLEEMLQCLDEGYPFVFGMLISKEFISAEVIKTGLITKVPTSPILRRGKLVYLLDKEDPIGSHCLTCVGWKYINNKKHFILQNSWSEKYGDKGYCYVPFEYVTNPALSTDFWTIRVMEN